MKKCFECDKEVTTQRNKFCSHSCAASFNNRKYPKRRPEDPDLEICGCGSKKDCNAARCHQCKLKNTIDTQRAKKIKDVLLVGNARIKFSQIRKMARSFMEHFEVEKKCKVCGFDICIEVAHIKPVSSFNEEALVGEVNSLSNMVYLCPNHHAMFDKKLLDLPM